MVILGPQWLMCPEKSFSWKTHFRQHGGPSDLYIICSQIPVNLHRLASHTGKKSNYWWNNLQVRGPPVCTHHGYKSSELDSEESKLVLRPGCFTGLAFFLTQLWAGEQVGFSRTAGYQGPENGPQPCLTQWNYEPCQVGPPKTDGSWWTVLTECGQLEKAMANHFSILALRTPWITWKGKKIGHWKSNSPGR